MSKARRREASYADTATVQQSMMKIYRLDGVIIPKPKKKTAKTNKQKNLFIKQIFLSTYMPNWETMVIKRDAWGQ